MIRSILKGITGEGFSIYRTYRVYDDQELMCLTVIHKGAFHHFIPAAWEIAV